MKKLSIIILGNDCNLDVNEEVEVIYYNGDIINTVLKASSNYISFIKSDDSVSDDYISLILDKVNIGFDACFLNNKVNYNGLQDIKILTNEQKLNNYKPYLGEYIWSFVYRKDKLLGLLNCSNKNFNDLVDMLFINLTSIKDIVYYHNPSNIILNNSFLVDERETKHYKNVIYVGNYCSGTFNGYISWLNNIGKCFNDYEITILYDNLLNITLNNFSKYFNCVKYNSKINYVCDRLLVTFSTFYYPKNLYPLEANYLFIHANMSDYSSALKYYDDIYSYYIAVSKTAALKANGYFNTDKIHYIYNPFKLGEESISLHLKLVSAQRSSGVKKLDRIEALASILDEEDIPYTWNVFTDKNEGVNKNGLIYRKRVSNPLPYIKDCDYFVLLSDSESFSYGVVEALSLNTKVVVTPLEVYREIGVNDDNAIVIPFEYFNDRNKLKEIVRRMCLNKDKTFNYEFDSNMYEGYKSIFKK